jgi:transcriptional/translational regulatory protein YebC/TACO1
LIVVTCAFSALNSVKKNLEDVGITIDTAEIVQIPTTYTEVPEDKKPSIEKILDNLDDLDDVNNVYTNAEL